MYNSFNPNMIKPSGWLKKQLEIQAKGLSGNLDLMWNNIKDSAWIGGNADSWEIVPYWLDGFIPLAYLLDDKDMKNRAKKYIDAIIERQNEDGWICPCTVENRPSYDVWAVFLIAKVLVLYYECSGDERIPDVIYSVLKNLQLHIKKYSIFNWAASRWFEALISIKWLYKRTNESWLLELATTLASQGTDYRRILENFSDKIPKREWSYQTHIVNAAMAVKSEELYASLFGKSDNKFAEDYYNTLLKYHGSAIGHIQGDECFAGTDTNHGAELCSIVEFMYSFEVLFELTGNPVWLDRAEQLGFNSLPATISEDMWTHQYLQLVNQIACAKLNEPSYFYTNNTEANMFGLEPHYFCCTGNFNQGWPKFALSTFYKSENGIVSAVLMPSKLECEINGTKVSVELVTEYPFKNQLKYLINTQNPIMFDFSIRIPGFVKKAFCNGKEIPVGDIYTVSKTFENQTEIVINFETEFEFCKHNKNGNALRKGPLFFSVPIKEDRKMIEYVKDGRERKFPYCDYQLLPDSEWRFAFLEDAVPTINERTVGDFPFSRNNPPVTVDLELARIHWDTVDTQPMLCKEVPENPKCISKEKVTLKPYGCTNLRITEMALADKKV